MSNKVGEGSGAGKGFAGLLNLVSDVDGDIAAAERRAAAPKAPKPEPNSAGSAGQDQVPWGLILFFFLVGIVCCCNLIFGIKKQDAFRSGGTSTPYSTSTTRTGSGPGVSPPGADQSKNDSATVPSSDAEPVKTTREQVTTFRYEQVPPVGTENVLNEAQILYCLAEDIRLKGADPALDSHSKSEVERYNSMVADFNSRCVRFRYKIGTLKPVEDYVESRKEALLAEGAARFRKPAATASSKPALPAPADNPSGNQKSESVSKPSSTVSSQPTETDSASNAHSGQDSEPFSNSAKWRVLPESSPETLKLKAIGDAIMGYYDLLQKKDVDGAIESFAAETKQKIKRSRIAAVAKDTEYYRIEYIDFKTTSSDDARCEFHLFHKKYKLPQEEWEMTVELTKEREAWKIRTISGQKVSP
jgi:hypothetical protein